MEIYYKTMKNSRLSENNEETAIIQVNECFDEIIRIRNLIKASRIDDFELFAALTPSIIELAETAENIINKWNLGTESINWLYENKVNASVMLVLAKVMLEQ